MDFTVTFKDEIEMLTDNEDRFKDFITEALKLVPAFQMEQRDVDYVKQVVVNVAKMCEVIEAEDQTRDILLSAAILHSICSYDEVDGSRQYDPLHMVHVRSFLISLQTVAGREDYNNIMLLIESQNGFSSPLPQLMPRLNDPVHMWVLPLAIRLTKE